MQYACVILSSVACPSLLYFSTLSHNERDFRKKKKILNLKCVFSVSVQVSSEIFLILRRTKPFPVAVRSKV